jgi:ElaB/YqjD/DUF883 family membrane-anchored ribosome-binding protein
MAPKDAEMPAGSRLGEDAQEIAKHIQSIRHDIERLTGVVARMGGHQIDHAKSVASGAASELEASVRRNPLSALAIAAGVGFLYGVLTRR